jgi:hypothetical protein
MLFAPAAAPPPGLPAVAEPSDIDHKSSNPAPALPVFVDADADADVEVVVPGVTGDVTVDRADIGFITGIPLYAGAVVGVELGRSCCEEAAASAVLRVPKGWGCAD